MRDDWWIVGKMLLEAEQGKDEKVDPRLVVDAFYLVGFRIRPRRERIVLIMKTVRTLRSRSINRSMIDGVPLAYAADVASALRNDRLTPTQARHLLRYRQAYAFGFHPDGKQAFAFDDESLSNQLTAAHQCELYI